MGKQLIHYATKMFTEPKGCQNESKGKLVGGHMNPKDHNETLFVETAVISALFRPYIASPTHYQTKLLVGNKLKQGSAPLPNSKTKSIVC